MTRADQRPRKGTFEASSRLRRAGRRRILLILFSILIGPAAVAQEWHGPTSGPAAAPGKRIVVVAENMRNGGIGGIVEGLNEAADVLQWHVVILDAAGDEAKQIPLA